MIFQTNEAPANNDMHKAHWSNVTGPSEESSPVEKKIAASVTCRKAAMALGCTQIRLESVSKGHVPVYPHQFIELVSIVIGKTDSKTVEKPGYIKIEKLVYTQIGKVGPQRGIKNGLHKNGKNGVRNT
jgi:hypothetical protein